MDPVEAGRWLEENMVKEFPLGVYVDKVTEVMKEKGVK